MHPPLVVYLSGPIAGMPDHDAIGWRNKIKNDLAPPDGILPDFAFLDPMRRDYRGVKMHLNVAKVICELDKADIARCQVNLRYWNGTPSEGTAQEFLFAWQNGKINILWVPDNDTRPIESLSPWLVYHSTFVCRGYDIVKSTLRRLRAEG